MRAVDDVVITRLETTGIDVNRGFVDVDNTGAIVTHPSPYLYYESSVGDDENDDTERLSGPGDKRSVFFSIGYTGLTFDQAKGAGEKAHRVLRRWRPTGTGIRKAGLVKLEQSQRIRRDDDAISLDGRPLYRGVSEFSVVITPEEFHA